MEPPYVRSFRMQILMFVADVHVVTAATDPITIDYQLQYVVEVIF